MRIRGSVGESGFSRREFLKVSGAGLAGLTVFGTAACGGSTGSESAEDYPSQDVTIIVPYSAGGPTDLLGRAVARYFEEEFGGTFLVENRTGGSATIGINEMVNSEPNGYTLGVIADPTAIIATFIEGTVEYSVDDFAYIGIGYENASVLAVRNDSQYQSAEEFFEAAEENPDELSVGTVGPNSSYGIALNRLRDEYDVRLSGVPFGGSIDIVSALRGGDIDAYFSSAGEAVFPVIEEGNFRALATANPERVDYLPDAIPISELGYENITNARSTYGLVAPQGTPTEILTKLEDGLRSALENQQVRETLGARYILDDFVGGDEWKNRRQELADEYEDILS